MLFLVFYSGSYKWTVYEFGGYLSLTSNADLECYHFGKLIYFLWEIYNSWEISNNTENKKTKPINNY